MCTPISFARSRFRKLASSISGESINTETGLPSGFFCAFIPDNQCRVVAIILAFFATKTSDNVLINSASVMLFGLLICATSRMSAAVDFPLLKVGMFIDA